MDTQTDTNLFAVPSHTQSLNLYIFPLNFVFILISSILHCNIRNYSFKLIKSVDIYSIFFHQNIKNAQKQHRYERYEAKTDKNSKHMSDMVKNGISVIRLIAHPTKIPHTSPTKASER